MIASPPPAPGSQVRPELRLVRNPKRTVPGGQAAFVPPPLIVPTPPASVATGNVAVISAIHATNVAPVFAPPHPQMQMLQPQLWKSVVGRHPGRYSGNAEDWPTWRRSWIPFLREVEGLWPVLSDRQQLALLRSALDDAGKLLLD